MAVALLFWVHGSIDVASWRTANWPPNRTVSFAVRLHQAKHSVHHILPRISQRYPAGYHVHHVDTQTSGGCEAGGWGCVDLYGVFSGHLGFGVLCSCSLTVLALKV
jgi:hypothetical protein